MFSVKTLQTFSQWIFSIFAIALTLNRRPCQIILSTFSSFLFIKIVKERFSYSILFSSIEQNPFGVFEDASSWYAHFEINFNWHSMRFRGSLFNLSRILILFDYWFPQYKTHILIIKHISIRWLNQCHVSVIAVSIKLTVWELLRHSSYLYVTLCREITTIGRRFIETIIESGTIYVILITPLITIQTSCERSSINLFLRLFLLYR